MSNPTPSSVRIVQRFTVPPEKLWQAWTDPAIIQRWFGSDPSGKVTSATLDVRTGGAFTVSFTDSDGTAHTCSGEYATVRPGNELAFSWRWQSEPHTESFVTVLLRPEGPGTEMRFEHSQLGAGSQHDYLSGWQRTFGKLASVVGEAS